LIFVWLARKSEEDEEIPIVKEHCKRIRTEYPKETENLADPERGDWEHGFNSGMLAAVRLIGAYVDGSKRDIKMMEEWFPDLDT